MLLSAIEYAEYVDVTPWEFAVGLSELRRIGLTETDLRFLLQLQLVEHAVEQPGDSWHPRQIHLSSSLLFLEQSCFVLTALGRQVAANIGCEEDVPSHATIGMLHADSEVASLVPQWNSELRVLFFRGTIVKRFARPASNQALVLSAFEEEKWPPRIYDPLAPHPSLDIKRRLSDTIKCLNQGHLNSLLRFRGDGSGEGILWEAVV